MNADKMFENPDEVMFISKPVYGVAVRLPRNVLPGPHDLTRLDQKMYLKLWVMPGCSPQCMQILPKWHLAGHVAGPDLFDTRTRRDAQKKFPFSPGENQLPFDVLHAMHNGAVRRGRRAKLADCLTIAARYMCGAREGLSHRG